MILGKIHKANLIINMPYLVIGLFQDCSKNSNKRAHRSHHVIDLLQDVVLLMIDIADALGDNFTMNTVIK